MTQLIPPDLVIVTSCGWGRRSEDAHAPGTIIQVEIHHVIFRVSGKGDVAGIDGTIIQPKPVPGTCVDNLAFIRTRYENWVVQQVTSTPGITQAGIRMGVIPALETSNSGESIAGIPGMDDVGAWQQLQPGIRAMIVRVKNQLDHLVRFSGDEP